ncbi:MAG: nucleotide exchange factor GrpE [Rhizobiaceae bacterium]|jgi:molecular chaperone GrpE|nr:nucleotide exchange factor GrpE [Rhizobiaceae bacterium]
MTGSNGHDANGRDPNGHSKDGGAKTADEALIDELEKLGGATPDDGVSEEASAEPDPLDILRAENAELKDRYVRLVAEMENLRRRTEREVKDARAFGIANFARDMLTVSDDLGRAMQVVRDSQHAVDPLAGVTALVEGIAATERAMLAAMERHGVTRIDPAGEKFDPNFHQAMFEVPDDTKPANTVVQVMAPGYKIGERMLRPAMVGVSKGGPKS